MTEPRPDRDHGAVPDRDQLISAVVDSLRLDVLPTLEGQPRYQVQVCVAALEVVQRELRSGSTVADTRDRVLRDLGSADERALVQEIRGGLDADRFAEVVHALTIHVEAELAIVRPAALRPAG
jgi:hypothetical protein